jgi:hypothetical protein
MNIPVNYYNYVILSDIYVPDQNTHLSEIIFYDNHEPHSFSYNAELEVYLFNLLEFYIKNKNKYKFLLHDRIECDDITLNARLKLFIKWSKKVGIYDNLYISTSYNNLNSDFNFLYRPWFLGWSVIDNLNFSDRSVSKKFLFLNTRPRKHRRILYDFFKDNDLLDESYWTFGTHEIYNPYVWDSTKYPLKNFNNNEEIPVGEMHKLISQYNDSFVSVVTETFFFTNDEVDTPWNNIQPIPSFVTEKTEKCFSALHPFIIVSTPYFLKHLKQLGFKTFDKWWDESYDLEENDDIRMQKIKLILLEISTWDNYKCGKILDEMMDVLIWNQQKNIEHEEQNKKYYRNINLI